MMAANCRGRSLPDDFFRKGMGLKIRRNEE
jgi:hypothetical protein